MNYKLFIPIILLLTIIIGVQGALTDNLLSYYKLDTTTNYTDSLGRVNGTNDGATITPTSYGKINQALNLSGNDKVDFTTDWIQTGTLHDFSISIWINSQMASGGVDGFILAQDKGARVSDFMFEIYKYPDSPYYRHYYSFTVKGSPSEYNFAINPPSENAWHHHIITFNASSQTVDWFVDDSLVSVNKSVLGANNWIPDAWSFQSFGDYPTKGIRPYTGYLDEVGFWNRTLSSSEVSQLYNSGSGLAYPFSTSTNATNFTIIAINTWNSSSILNFTANIINGVNYTFSTINGTINTNISSNYTSLVNITITSPNMDNVYYYNYNVSSNLQASMNFTDTTPPSIYCSLNGLTNVSGHTTNLNITITEPYLTNTTIKIEGLNNETNNSHRTNHYYGSSNWNITNITSIGNYQINISATDFNGNSANYSCNYTIIPNNSTFKVYVYDYLNSTLVSSISIFDTNTSETQTNNPFSKDTTNYLSKLVTWNLVQMNIEDTSYYHVDQNSSFNITRFGSIFSTSMIPNKLILSFYSGGSLTTATGFVNDEYPSTRGFTNTSIMIIQQNLSEGKVQVIFNDYANWTQYYEYINDYKTFINESLEVIPKTNLWSGYFQVLDVSGSPIENAVIRMQYSIGTNSTTQYGMLLGQRLTAPDGYTFFIADKSSQAYLTIYKNGYTPQTYQLSFGDESFTRSSPKVFYLKQENSIVKENAWAYIPYEYRTITPIPITITSIDYDKIEIQTPFRNASGFSLKDVTNKDILGRTRFYLYPGQDYNSTTPTDITLYIYLDNNLWTNYTIRYNPQTNTTKIFTPTETDSSMQTKIGAVVEFLALLIMILIMNLLFKESRAGLHTFMGGTIVLAIINPLYFIWLGFIGGGFYIFKIVQYIISE